MVFVVIVEPSVDFLKVVARSKSSCLASSSISGWNLAAAGAPRLGERMR